MLSPRDAVEAEAQDRSEIKKLTKLVQEKIRGDLSLSVHTGEIAALVRMVMENQQIPEPLNCLLVNRKAHLEALEQGKTSAACITPAMASEKFWILHQDKSILKVLFC